MRPPKPKIVVLYEEVIKNGPPRCCHTCAEYDEDGQCLRFDSEPPEAFAATPDACQEWIMEIPF